MAKVALQRLRTQILCEMMGKVEEAIDQLRLGQREFETNSKLCAGCKRHKPTPTKRCNTCLHDQFLPICCDARSRVYDFLEWLSTVHVRPLSQHMEDSAKNFQAKVGFVQMRIKHDCRGGDQCPLLHATKMLKNKVDRVMTQSKGLDLRAFQKDNRLAT